MIAEGLAAVRVWEGDKLAAFRVTTPDVLAVVWTITNKF